MEADAKYIKGMINNPDIQPSAMINLWIAGMLLFYFKLKHAPGKDHASEDGLSRRPQAPKVPIDDGDHEYWIDKSYAFRVELLNWTIPVRTSHSYRRKEKTTVVPDTTVQTNFETGRAS